MMTGIAMTVCMLNSGMAFLGEMHRGVLGHKHLRYQHNLQRKKTKNPSFHGHVCIKYQLL